MRGWRSKLLAILLAFCFVPGAYEVAENAAHLLAEGHLAHFASATDHRPPPGDEHGCSPVFHLCGCHASMALEAPPPPVVVELDRAVLSRWQAALPRLADVSFPLDHPPRA